MRNSDSLDDESALPPRIWDLHGVRLGGESAPRLRIMSLAIPQGVTAVIGPSGAGKTSLLNLLVGFESPEVGHISSNLTCEPGRRSLDWVPTDFGLWPHLTVSEHLLANRSPSIGEGAIDQILGRFRLHALADVYPGRLSQGERSRLAIARALVSDAQALVLDEPLVHVDPLLQNICWQSLREHCRTRNSSLVFSSHASERVLREADNVVCLDAGRLMFAGDVQTLYQAPASLELALFLGPVNWFEGEECAIWMPGSEPMPSTAVCLRPEQVELVPAETGPLIVEATADLGVVCETLIRDQTSQGVRTVLHRSARPGPLVGSHVRLRLCALLWLCLLVCGCQPSAHGPTLKVLAARTLRTPPAGTSLPAPRSLTVSGDGELYVLDNAGRILVYDAEGTLARQWTMPEYEIGKPEGVCVLADGRIAVADTHYARIVVFDRDGGLLQMFGERGESPGEFIFPVGITTDDHGHLYVAEYGGNDRVQKFTNDGEFLGAFGSFGVQDGQFQRPSGLVWHEGVLFVADAINNRVQKFSDTGEFLGVLRNDSGQIVSLEYPYDISLGQESTLFVVEYGAGRITQLGLDGSLKGRYGKAGRGDAQLWTPWGLAFDPRGRLYVADTGNRRIVELSL